jgi:hypothetical protein
MAGVVPALLAAVLIAALMTLGDFVWARFVPSHRVVYGLLHGLALCLAMGLVLGVPRRRAIRGAVGGAAIGLSAALFFYALAPFLGWRAMLPAWMAFWIALAFLQGRGLGAPTAPVSEIVARGSIAAVASGLAFWLISGIWTQPPGPGGPDYPRHFLSWAFAFLPGFLALGLRRPGPDSPIAFP